MNDWIFRTDEYICDLRTVGVLVRDGKLLVQRDRDGSEYALPGGHVKIGETTAVNTPGRNRQFDRASPTPLPLKSYTLSVGPTPSV